MSSTQVGVQLERMPPAVDWAGGATIYPARGDGEITWSQVGPGVRMAVDARNTVVSGGFGYLHFEVGPRPTSRKQPTHKIQVLLTEMDDYRVALGRYDRESFEWALLETRDEVYCDQLDGVILDLCMAHGLNVMPVEEG